MYRVFLMMLAFSLDLHAYLLLMSCFVVIVEMRTQVAFGKGNSSYARSFPMQSSAGIKILCVSNVLSLAEPSTW